MGDRDSDDAVDFEGFTLREIVREDGESDIDLQLVVCYGQLEQQLESNNSDSSDSNQNKSGCEENGELDLPVAVGPSAPKKRKKRQTKKQRDASTVRWSTQTKEVSCDSKFSQMLKEEKVNVGVVMTFQLMPVPRTTFPFCFLKHFGQH